MRCTTIPGACCDRIRRVGGRRASTARGAPRAGVDVAASGRARSQLGARRTDGTNSTARAASVIAPAVKMAIALDPYVVRVVFADGEVRDVDIEPLLGGPIFEELREPRSFAQVEVDEYGETIVWPNGADLIPTCSTASLSRRAGRRHAS